MPVVIAPVLAVGGYRAVVVLFILMAALASALMWHAVVRATNAIGAATFAWATVVATTPFLFNSFAVYPEIPAALAAVVALTVTFGGAGPREALTQWLIVGLSCATLPWFSTKYAPMSAALVAIAAVRILWPSLNSDPRPTSAALRGSPRRDARCRICAHRAARAIRGVARRLVHFFYVIWGTPWPQAPYGALVQTSPWNLVFGAPGLLFDQEYGLLPYAPVYVLAVTGLWAMWRDRGELRRRAIEITVVFAALLATVGAFRIWWGGSASPGRPLTSGLLLLALPIAMAFRSAPAGGARRAAQHLLLWLSVGIAVLALTAQQGSSSATAATGRLRCWSISRRGGRPGHSSLRSFITKRQPHCSTRWRGWHWLLVRRLSWPDRERFDRARHH